MFSSAFMSFLLSVPPISNYSIVNHLHFHCIPNSKLVKFPMLSLREDVKNIGS
jgi:diadenosine tetraphosphate (Ap4A) HIT family hydrolase